MATLSIAESHVIVLLLRLSYILCTSWLITSSCLRGIRIVAWMPPLLNDLGQLSTTCHPVPIYTTTITILWSTVVDVVSKASEDLICIFQFLGLE